MHLHALHHRQRARSPSRPAASFPSRRSECEFDDFSDRIFTAPGLRSRLAFACALATQAGLVSGSRRASHHAVDVAPDLRLDQRHLIVAFDVLDREEPRQQAADHEEQQHPEHYQA